VAAKQQNNDDDDDDRALKTTECSGLVSCGEDEQHSPRKSSMGRLPEPDAL